MFAKEAHVEMAILIDEDDELADTVTERMLAAGAPVRA
jgi:hypothetical protein